MLSLLLCFACRPASSPTESAPMPVDSSWQVDSAPPGLARFTLAGEAAFKLAWAGYTVQTWQADDPRLQAPDGLPGRFLLARPSAEPTGPVRLLVVLHGGVLDVDSNLPEGLLERCGSDYAALQASRLVVADPLIQVAAETGTWVLVPENPWCDGWMGLGEDDPVDPTHRGAVLIDAAIAHQEVGIEALWFAGHSQGAIGAVYAANRRGDVQGLVVDSGPPDLTAYATDAGYGPETVALVAEILEHTIGPVGSPRYAAGSLVEGSPTPTFHLWNAQDPLSTANQHQPVAAVLEASGQRWISWDLDHAEPQHPQGTDLRTLYASVAAMGFLRGGSPEWISAEGDVEAPSAVGGTVNALAETWSQELSVEGAVEATFWLSGTATLSLGDQTTPVQEVDLNGEDYAGLRAQLGTLRLGASSPQQVAVEPGEDTLLDGVLLIR